MYKAQQTCFEAVTWSLCLYTLKMHSLYTLKILEQWGD